MDFKQFTKEVLKIKSPVKTLNVSIESLQTILKVAALSGDLVDQLKKSIFLKRYIDMSKINWTCSLIYSVITNGPSFKCREGLDETLKFDISILHGIMGIITEAAELADILTVGLVKGLTDESRANLKEELGDLLHYIALVLDACGWELDEVLDTNIAKLSIRYKGGFSFEKANNRDLEAEKQAMEQENV